MIQRKQTLWLTLISIICFSSIYLNIPYRDVDGKIDAKVIEDAMVHIGFSHTSIDIIGKERTKTESNALLKYSLILLGVLSLAAIALHKNRTKQLLIGKIHYALIALIMFLMYYYGWSKRYVDLEPDGQLLISLLFPFIMAWANYKAISGIKKDENLVKSYDRIR